jgi:hypothetical protein
MKLAREFADAIVKQALDGMPDGPIKADAPKVV